jgi:NAD(P)-dependent dehydrogenase (short-subunit alcohol dehydrogenase family)
VAGAAEGAGVLAPLAPGTELNAANYGEAKAAIEHWTTELAGDRAHL